MDISRIFGIEKPPNATDQRSERMMVHFPFPSKSEWLAGRDWSRSHMKLVSGPWQRQCMQADGNPEKCPRRRLTLKTRTGKLSQTRPGRPGR